jgi:hypothetical protein
MAKLAGGLTISQRAQIRKMGFPYQTREFPTHEDADEWGLAGSLSGLRVRAIEVRAVFCTYTLRAYSPFWLH